MLAMRLPFTADSRDSRSPEHQDDTLAAGDRHHDVEDEDAHTPAAQTILSAIGKGSQQADQLRSGLRQEQVGDGDVQLCCRGTW